MAPALYAAAAELQHRDTPAALPAPWLRPSPHFTLPLPSSRASLPAHTPSRILRGCRASAQKRQEPWVGEPRRVLVVTLEFRAGTFSGNGVYCQSLVAGLTSLGHPVLVLSAAPDDVAPGPGSPAHPEVLEVPVPAGEWGRLDWRCAWGAFARGVAASPALASRVLAFAPHWALVVDWSAMPAFLALRPGQWSAPMAVYMNFRVFSASQFQGPRAQEESCFYRTQEAHAMARAWGVLAASARDALFLQQELSSRRTPAAPRPQALLPSLREDIRQLALPHVHAGEGLAPEGQPPSALPASQVWGQRRRFLCCCVRLSPEKNAELFAALLEHLGPFLTAQGIVPLVCAGTTTTPYAEGVLKRVAAACPSAVIVREFLGPQDLGTLFSQTLLNVHPCLYDAYGMTIVEAAAFGAPSLVNTGDSGPVGATELLGPQDGLSFGFDFSTGAQPLAEHVKEMLADSEGLANIGLAARRKSLSWSMHTHAAELTGMLEAWHSSYEAMHSGLSNSGE